MNLPADITWRLLERDEAGDWERVLTAEEKVMRASFGSAVRQESFTLGRVAARTLLAERLDVEPAEVPLRVAEDGAVLVEGSDLHVSIAHSGGRAAAVAARRAVGIDLERIAPRHAELHRFLLHPEEYPLMETLGLDRPHAHILCWSLKEATLKGLRTGFRLSPKKLRLVIDLGVREASVRVEGGAVWQARFEERDGFYVVVAFDGRRGPG